MMKNKQLFLYAAALLFAACRPTYQVTNITRSRILIDSTYDRHPDAAALRFIAPFQTKVDSIMSPVVGHAAHYMAAHRPESDLSNLLADILLWAADQYKEHPDMAVYNMGGIRAALAAGDVTYGDVVDIAPFDNKISFLTLTGTDLLQLFRQIAAVGGEGVSRGVELRISPQGELLSATLHGREIQPSHTYRIATIDYLAQGNDKLEAFKKGTDRHAPDTEENNTRYIIRNYFLHCKAQGKSVDSHVEGRIKIIK